MRFYGMTVDEVLKLTPYQFTWLCEEMEDMT